VLSVSAVNRALEKLPDCQLINGYGPTENTTFTCCHSIGKTSSEHRSIPIGRPIANTQVYVLDEICSRCQWVSQANFTPAATAWRVVISISLN